jgi:micrococcal nuclease
MSILFIVGMLKMKLRQISLCFICIALTGLSTTTYNNAHRVSVVSVYDGDTFRVNIAGWRPIIGQNIPIRVRGVDTPELRGECDREKLLALEARDFTKNFLESGKISLKNNDRGKYFRIVSDVYVDGKLLSEALINKGLGYEYDGKTKKRSWC